MKTDNIKLLILMILCNEISGVRDCLVKTDDKKTNAALQYGFDRAFCSASRTLIPRNANKTRLFLAMT
jgi:hypothetical protein